MKEREVHKEIERERERKETQGGRERDLYIRKEREIHKEICR